MKALRSKVICIKPEQTVLVKIYTVYCWGKSLHFKKNCTGLSLNFATSANQILHRYLKTCRHDLTLPVFALLPFLKVHRIRECPMLKGTHRDHPVQLWFHTGPPKLRLYVWKHCSNAPWTPAALCCDHCPLEPRPWPPSSEGPSNKSCQILSHMLGTKRN